MELLLDQLHIGPELRAGGQRTYFLRALFAVVYAEHTATAICCICEETVREDQQSLEHAPLSHQHMAAVLTPTELT